LQFLFTRREGNKRSDVLHHRDFTR
jgi:hypothetical protein